jgi:hypothetical protein
MIAKPSDATRRRSRKCPARGVEPRGVWSYKLTPKSGPTRALQIEVYRLVYTAGAEVGIDYRVPWARRP